MMSPDLMNGTEHALSSLAPYTPCEGHLRAEGEMDCLALFVRVQERRGLRPRTILKRKDDLSNFDRFMRARDGGVLNATREDIEAWLDAKGDIASNTRAAYISGLHAFYVAMIDEGILLEDPTRKVTRPKVRLGLPRPCTDDELRIALKYAPPRERCFVALAAYAGLRCQEIAHLDVEDLLWASGVLRVSAFAAKGGKERVIPIHPEVEKVLRNYGLPKQGAMFLRPRGRRITPERVSQLGSAYLEDAGLNLTMHQFRHWFGTNVAKLGIRTAQELLGHADLKSTAIYTKVTADDLRSAVDSLHSL